MDIKSLLSPELTNIAKNHHTMGMALIHVTKAKTAFHCIKELNIKLAAQTEYKELTSLFLNYDQVTNLPDQFFYSDCHFARGSSIENNLDMLFIITHMDVDNIVILCVGVDSKWFGYHLLNNKVYLQNTIVNSIVDINKNNIKPKLSLFHSQFNKLESGTLFYADKVQQRDTKESAEIIPLTSLERKCFQMIYDNIIRSSDIAQQLEISKRTVDDYIERLKVKFSCNNKYELYYKIKTFNRRYLLSA
ncbi:MULTISPECIES: helix-turn-helix transcriptional regulator [Cysteiniphilum]|uniref:HTH luxR-type domain-containing protein n=1 Tax=Cysteiniphilum litorale TaxID=2056700 RepID=A0A8J2Z5I7_9GAMM|nr:MULTISPECIES: LuxR C-terminal-related transcriptional regulator [Cysteiniphilum]GGG02806.1 hypothetical protein GCM10010995_20280 [Cysteiniphilum litorale]